MLLTVLSPSRNKNITMVSKLILVLGLFFPILAFAQPSNDECSSPDTITLLANTASSVSQDATTATVSSPDPSCQAAVKDIWFTFTMPVDGNILILANPFSNFAVYTACGGSELTCQGNKGFTYSLTQNTSYVLRAWKTNGFNGSIDFSIEAFVTAINNECSTATTVTIVEGSSTLVNESVNGATQSPISPMCENNDFLDIWYSFQMPIDGNLKITGGSFNKFAVYDACGGNEIICNSNYGFTFDLSENTTYKIRGWRTIFYPGDLNFSLDIYSTIANDSCMNAIPITLTVGTPSTITLDVNGATQDDPLPTCESNDLQDVWYSFVMPVNGTVFIGGSSFNKFAIYDACGGNEISCENNLSYTDGLVAGTTYYLRAFRRIAFSSYIINFSIEAFEEITNDECSSPTTIIVNEGSSTQTVQNVIGATQSTQVNSCTSDALRDVWYKFTMPVDGNILISGNSFSNFSLFDMCNGNEIACMGTLGYGFSLSANSDYLIRGWRREAFPGELNFTIEAFSAVSNDECNDAEMISVSSLCTGATTTIELRGATPSNVTPDCNNNEVVDAWYTFDSPIDGTIFVKNSNSFSNYTFYDGCPVSQMDIDNPLACFFGNGIVENISFGQTIILQVSRRLVYPDEARFCLEGAYAVSDPQPLVCTDGLVNVTGANNDQWIPILDSNSKLIASIHPNGQSLGITTAETYITTDSVYNFNGQPLLRRKIIVTPEFQPSSDVKVRLYFLDSEVQDLVEGDINLTSPYYLNTMKNDQEICSEGYDGSGEYINGVVSNFGNDFYLQFNVNSFSSFFLSSTDAALPLTLVDFDGANEDDSHLLSWKTISEINFSHFEVETKVSSGQWQTIGKVSSLGNQLGKSEYNYINRDIVGSQYYRLKMMDKDGSYSYSSTIYIKENLQYSFSIYPSPSIDILNIESPKGIYKIKIVDIYGNTMLQKSSETSINSIDISELNTGIYFLKTEHNKLVKFIKL